MERIIFVDDEAHQSKPYRDRLAGAEFAVTYFEAARPAIKWIRDGNAFDFLVMDLQLAREGLGEDDWVSCMQMTGLWGLAVLREVVVPRRVPVLVLTQKDPTEFEDAISGLNFPGHLLHIRRKLGDSEKYPPVDPRDLPTLVRSIITRVRSSR